MEVKMSKKLSALLWILIFISTAVLYGDVPHASDPRGKIEKITGEGEFVWDMNETKLADCVKEGKEAGKEFTVREITWTVKGGGQDWMFTRTKRMGDDNNSTVKTERFWITIMKADGVWVTRTKYRYKEGEAGEVGDKDKGGKFSASSRISGKTIILSLTKKKQGRLFRITKKDGLMQVIYITMPDLIDWTMSYKKK